MQTNVLHVELKQAEGALLRLIGTIERRGFQVQSLHTHSGATAQSWKVEITVAGVRSPDILCRQLERLVDVLHAAPMQTTTVAVASTLARGHGAPRESLR